jgi:hypothetical protein
MGSRMTLTNDELLAILTNNLDFENATLDDIESVAGGSCEKFEALYVSGKVDNSSYCCTEILLKKGELFLPECLVKRLSTDGDVSNNKKVSILVMDTCEGIILSVWQEPDWNNVESPNKSGRGSFIEYMIENCLLKIPKAIIEKYGLDVSNKTVAVEGFYDNLAVHF